MGVLGTASLFAEPRLDAAVKQAGTEDVGDDLFARTVAEVADLALGVVGMVHVPEQGVIEFLEGSALLGGLHIGENLFAGVRVVPVVHGEFHQLGQVGLAFEGHVGALALYACAHAAEDDRKRACLVQRDAAGSETDQRAGHGGVHVHELGLPGAGADDFSGLF